MSGAAPRRLTEAEAAERAGTTPDRIRALVDLGILERDEDGTFAPREVLRARVVGELEEIGVPPEGVARALASGLLSLGYLESTVRRHPRSDRTYADVADGIGISFASLQRMYIAWGLARPESHETVREEDLEVLGSLPALLTAGVDEDEIARLARVWGESVRRIAEYLSHHFHVAVEEPFRRKGLDDNAAFEAAIREVGLRFGRSGEELLTWLYRRHSETYVTRHQWDHAEAALEAAGVHERTSPRPGAAAFADLTGYTRLTEEAGDEVAARVSLTLAEVVSEIAARHRGTVVKMLGDGVHFHFAEPRDAVLASLDVLEAVEPRGLPPAHIGVEAGPMIYDEGDYFGRTVNLAARIAAQAGPGQVLAGDALARAVAPEGFRYVELGTFEMKGIATPQVLRQVVRD